MVMLQHVAEDEEIELSIIRGCISMREVNRG